MAESAISHMLADGYLERTDERSVDDWLSAPGLRVLFFSGGPPRRREAHDVAVALREVLRDYPSSLRAAIVAEASETALQPRFRVLVKPSLVLAVNRQNLEVLPGVRDWSEYAEVFRRYLGAPEARKRSA